MTSSTPISGGDNDDWEYEYDQSESEVFFVDLDLTTLRRSFKTTGTDRGRKLVDLPDKTNSKKQRISYQNQATPLVNSESKDPTQAQEVNEDDDAEDIPLRQHSIQFLDLHTGNPIVSFKGEAYSCSWTDMIGTNMFLSQPKDTPLYDPEMSTNDFDMVGTSRIKLVGNPIKVTPIPQNTAASVTRQKTTPTHSEAPQVPAGKSLGTIRRSNAKVNADLRKQANFLEQLMNIKKNRGEQDNIHVVMNGKISKTIAAGKLKFKTQRKEEEIDQLNRRIVRGDGEALRELEQIYSGREEDSDDDASAGEEVDEAAVVEKLIHRPVQALEAGDGSDRPSARPGITSTINPSSEEITNLSVINTNNNDG